MILAAAMMTFGISAMAKGTGEVGSVGTLKVDKHSLAIMELPAYKAYFSDIQSAMAKIYKQKNQTVDTKCSDLQTDLDPGAGLIISKQTCKINILEADGSLDNEMKLVVKITGLYSQLDAEDANGNSIPGEDIYVVTTIAGNIK